MKTAAIFLAVLGAFVAFCAIVIAYLSACIWVADQVFPPELYPGENAPFASFMGIAVLVVVVWAFLIARDISKQISSKNEGRK